MSAVIRVHAAGGPEVLSFEDEAPAVPGPGEVLVRQEAIGVNFIDVYQRRGFYPLPLPFVPGTEGAGVIEALGPGVEGWAVGQRVANIVAPGGYAAHRVLPADRLIALPDDVDVRTAAAVMLKGLTAQYLLRRTFPVAGGHTVLFHAAAGGVGLIACQWAAALGATVIGTVGSEEKAALARGHGCRHVINYTRQDFVARVREITAGAGVDVVYDSVGRDTFPGSLDVLRPRGTWVSFGQSSGPVPDFSVLLLMQKGSLFATRPTIGHYTATAEELAGGAAELFAVLRSGLVRAGPRQTYPLAEAAEAHRALEARRTLGSTVLVA